MKRRIVKHLGFSLFLFSILLVLLNCNDPFQTPDIKENENNYIPAGWGTVRLLIADTQYTSARTIFPQNPLQFFSAYRLVFEPQEEQEKIDGIEVLADQNGDIKNSIALEVGEWEITAFGIIIYEGEEREIAEGSVIVTVIADTNIEATIVLQSMDTDGGMGTFTWDLTIPQNIAADTYSISLTCWESGTKPISYTNMPIENDSNISGSTQIRSGYYLLRASIGIKGQEAFYVEIVHIMSYRTSSFEHTVKPDEFVPVQTLSGMVSAFSVNGVPFNPVDPMEVRAYLSSGVEVAFANINSDRTWNMPIVRRTEDVNISFSISFVLGDNPMELKTDSLQLVLAGIDKSGIDIIVPSIRIIIGGLDLHPVRITKYNWEVMAYTQDTPIQPLNAVTPIRTDQNGRWSIVIDASVTPTHFSVENEDIGGKKYKRNGLILSTRPDNSEQFLAACFSPPRQVSITGNIPEDGMPKVMHPFVNSDPIKDYMRFTFTRNNTSEDQKSLFFTLEANFCRDDASCPISPVRIYDYSNIIKSNEGLELYNKNGAIAWYNESSNNILPDRNNVLITLDFRNNGFFDEGEKPVLKVENRSEVLIPSGTFLMGSPTSEVGRNGPSGKSSETQNNVRLNSFYMMSTVVTQGMYGDENLKMNAPLYTGGPGFIDQNYPVVNISWWDAIEFANKLSEKEGLTLVYNIVGTGSNRSFRSPPNWNASGWRLPTEAEWEYAARAGSNTPFAPFYNLDGVEFRNGEDINFLLANFNGITDSVENHYNSMKGQGYADANRRIFAVDHFPLTNAWGLFNMHGNVWEFCWDLFGGDYPTTPNPRVDPQGHSTGNWVTLLPNGTPNPNTTPEALNSRGQRIIRGGSYHTPARYLRSAHRGIIGENVSNYNDIGFRLVRNYIE